LLLTGWEYSHSQVILLINDIKYPHSIYAGKIGNWDSCETIMNQSKTKPIHITEKERANWWRQWFNHVYMDVYAHRDDDRAENEAATTLSVLPIEPHQKILDLCCGNGRHCRALRQAGFENVVGVDYSLPLLEHALAEPVHSVYVRGDMRLLPFHDGCMDAVLSFFTSFGYFITNLENLAVLDEIMRVLRTGGRFLLDYLNPTYVRGNFVPESVKEHGEFVIHERRSISEDGERIEKEIVINNWGGEDHIYHESVRLYECAEMVEMLRSANLRVDGILGSFDGQTFSENSPRMILHGTRM
jgi:SAM-dependent methyltransferase